MLFVSPSGSLVESNRVYPYGEKWMANYGTSNDQKFTTYTRQDDHYTDEVDYAMTRYYFYSHGAFMSPDMSGANVDLADPQSWNAYAYVNGDPIDFTDPSGEGLFGFLLKLAGVVVSIFNPGLGAVIFGSSLPLGHINVGGTPPFNPNAQGPPVPTTPVFSAPFGGNAGNSPIPTGGVFQPPVIVKPQLIFDAVVPYISQDRFEQGLPSWLPGWSKALLWGIFSDPTPGLFAMEAGGLFEKAGIATTQHFRGRVIGRAARGITESGALDAYRNGRLYYDPVSRNFIRYSSRTGISVVTDAPSGGRAITVFEGKPSPNWNPVPWRPGQ